MSNTYNIQVEGNLEFEALAASFGYEYEETFDHLERAPLEYAAKDFPGGRESFIKSFTHTLDSIDAAIREVDKYLKSSAELILGEGFKINGGGISKVKLDSDTVTFEGGDCACCTGWAWYALDVTLTSELDEYEVKNCVYDALTKLMRELENNGCDCRIFVKGVNRFTFKITEN